MDNCVDVQKTEISCFLNITHIPQYFSTHSFSTVWFRIFMSA